MIELALILGIGLIAFIFAYLSLNLSKKHAPLQILFLLLSFISIILGTVFLSWMTQDYTVGSNFAYIPEATMDKIGEMIDHLFNAFIWVLILLIVYFILTLLIASGKLMAPKWFGGDEE